MTESGLDPLALHDNTTDRKEDAGSRRQATSDAARWVERGDSVDIGLMQINSANLPALGLSVTTALDPCASMAAGAAILRAAYGGGGTPADRQAALLIALSRYNTGSPLKGILNGYDRRVLANAGTQSLPALSPLAPAESPSNPAAPPSWNISAAGAYAQIHGAPWFVALAPAVPGKSMAGSPPAPTPTPTPTADRVADSQTGSPPILSSTR